MPFKIVSTRRRGKVELCTVPETWEVKGILRWPKMYGDILAKNDSTQPQTDWLTYNCVVKRRNYRTYEEAEDELTKMLDRTDTDDTDYGEQSYKRTTTPEKVPNLNAAAQQIMIKSGNPKKRMKQPTSTLQARQILQESPSIPASSTTPASSAIPASSWYIQASSTIPASSTTPASSAIPASSWYIPTSSTTPASSAIPANLSIPATSTIPVSSTIPASSPIFIDDTLYTITTNDENINTQINNIYEMLAVVLDNQNKIMKKLAEMSVQLQEQSTENITVTTLAQAKGAETKRMRMDVVDNIESLEKLNKDLSCPIILKTYLEKYAILCSAAPGSGSNCAYRLLDSIFTKDFLCQCSWTGGSRGDDLKIGFKKYKNILQFFFEMVYYWDKTYTVQDNEIFFKNILRNALKRKTTKNIRQSSKKRRKLQPKRVQHKPQNQRSAANNNVDEDIMNNINNYGEVNINDDANNDDENNTINENEGDVNEDANKDHENNTINENEPIIEEDE